MAAATVGRGPMVRPKKASFDGGAADFSQQPARIKAGLFPSYAQSRMRPAGTGLHPRPERLVPREMGYFSSCSLCKSLLQRRRSQQLVWGCFLVSRGAFFSSRFCSIPASPAGCDVWGWMAFGASLANESRAGQKPRCKQRSQPSPARTHGDAVPLAAVLPFSAVLLPPAQVSWYQVTRPSREICSPEAPEKMSGMQVRCREPCAPLLLGVGVGGRCSEPPLTSSPPLLLPPQAVWPSGTECIAKYNFHGTAEQDLPFSKGDVLTIVAVTKVMAIGSRGGGSHPPNPCGVPRASPLFSPASHGQGASLCCPHRPAIGPGVGLINSRPR